MNFLHAWAIGIGAIAIAAPFAVHWLTKPRPVAFRLSTVLFLQEVIQQRRSRSRLRDWLILALRSLCIGLLALAVARPLFQERQSVLSTSANDAQRVIVLDCSQSMSAGSGGVTSWSSAVASALQYLEDSPGMQAGVILAGARARPVFDQLSPNFVSLREAIKQASPMAEKAEPRVALEQAAKLLAKAPAGTKEIVIISDFQRTNWGTLLLDLVPVDTQVQFHSVAQSNTDNLAITAVRFSSEPVVGQSVAMEVDVANFSDRETTVRCNVDLNAMKRSFEGLLPPQSTKTFSELVSFDEVGWKFGWARLESNLDVLPDDDQRPVALQVRPPVRVLMISKQSANEVPSSSFYLQQALNVSLSGSIGSTSSGAANATDKKGNETIVRVNPVRDDARNWPQCDVYVIDHPGSLASDSLQMVASQLKRGKGLLYVASELVDAVNLKHLGEILGSDFQPPVELVPGNDNELRKELFVRQVKSREPPFNVLGSEDAASLLTPIRFRGGLGTRATSEGLRDQVLAELSDTSALLYLSSVGAGQLAVLNTDLSRSNWAVQPTFLPVMGELTKSLLAQRGQNDQIHSGEPLVRMLPTTITDSSQLKGKTIDGPAPGGGDFGQWQWVAGQSSVVWNWKEPPGAGIYSLEENAVPVWMVATSAPASESNLSALDKEVLTKRIGGDRTVGFATSDSGAEKSDDIWKWLVVGCLFGLIGEIVALRWNRM